MTPTALQWLPIGLGVAASLLGLVGLGAAALPGRRNRPGTLTADSALYLVTGLLLLLPVFALSRNRVATLSTPSRPLIEMVLTSDPAEADVYLDGTFAGRTPVTFQRPQGTLVRYRVQASEAAPGGFVYESYAGEVTVEEAVTVSVWLNREPLEP